MAKKKQDIFQQIRNHNHGYNVNIGYKNAKNGWYYLYLDYYEDEVRKRPSLRLKIKGDKDTLIEDGEKLRLALAKREDLDKKLRAGDTGDFLIPKKKVDFLEFFNNYANTKIDRNYKISYDHFRQFLNKGRLDIKSVNYKLCKDYREYLVSLPIKPYTALHYLVTFKATLNSAVKLGLINRNPGKDLTIKYEKKLVKRLTAKELKQLMDTECNYSDLKNGFVFACFTGLRFSDLTRLEYTDIQTGKLKIVLKKTGTEIEIKLHPKALEILKEQKKKHNTGSIFRIPTGGKTSRNLKKWFKNAGLSTDYTFHCSRHTFGCFLVESKVELFTIMKLMGHRNVSTTMQYIEKVNTTEMQQLIC